MGKKGLVTSTAWRKGQSGNPRGRKPGLRPLTELLRQGLEETTSFTGPDGTARLVQVKDAIARIIIGQALEGEQWAIQMLFDRVEGKVKEAAPLEEEAVEATVYSISFGVDRDRDEAEQRPTQVGP